MKKIYLCLLILSLLLDSCQQPEKMSFLTDSNRLEVVKEETIFQISRNFNVFVSANVGSSIPAKRIRKADKIIKNLTTVRDETGDALYHIITYQEGGFLIMSADRRVLPILAFSDSNDFPIDKEVPSGVSEALSAYKESITSARKSKSPVDARITNEWSRLENTEAIDKWVASSKRSGSRTMSEGEPGPCQDSQIYVDLGTAEWGQDWNYNTQMPLQSTIPCTATNMPNGRAFTGCAATAIAEVANYHHWPNTYNWSAMGPTFSETARLMRNAANSVNTVYTCSASNSYASAIGPALTFVFGYSSTYSSFNANTVSNEILNFSRPVILAGQRNNFGGHAWVCDGYYQYYPCSGSTNSPMLLMNWGWEGYCNGFYSTGIGFDPYSQSTYFQDLTMVTGIRH